MEIEAKFAVPDRETFKRLKKLDKVASYDLSEGQVEQIRDAYLDTPDRRIMRARYMCRRREKNGKVIVTLKRLKAVSGAVHRREELELELPTYQPPAEWPAGQLRDQVLDLIGDARLKPLFGLRQKRFVRKLIQSGRTVGELSLDEVYMASDDREKSFLELEAELAEAGTERDLDAITAHFEVEWGLEAQPRSKFERALEFFGEETASGTENRSTSVAPPKKKPPKRPELTPDDSMAEAARKTLYLHFQRMLYHEPGTRAGDDIEELHDMRVATRRMRAAIRVFGDYLEPKAIKPFNKELRRTGKVLGGVRDLDVFGEKMQAYLDTLPLEERDALDPLLAVWEVERETAREKMLDHLDSKRYARFKTEFNEFLQTPGAGARPVVSDDGEPRPHRLRHVVPGAVYDRLAHVRAYDEWVTQPDVPLERLHELRIAFKRLRYTLEFFQEVLGPEAETVIDECKALQDHLGDLQDAGVASNLLRDFLTWGTWGPQKGKKASHPTEPVIAPGVAAYLATKHTEIQRLVETFPEAWARFQSSEIREATAAAVAVL